MSFGFLLAKQGSVNPEVEVGQIGIIPPFLRDYIILKIGKVSFYYITVLCYILNPNKCNLDLN